MHLHAHHSSFLGDPIPPEIKLSNSQGLKVLLLLAALPCSLSLLALTFLFLLDTALKSFSGLFVAALLLPPFLTGSSLIGEDGGGGSFEAAGSLFLVGLLDRGAIVLVVVVAAALRANLAAFNLALTLAASASRSDAASLAAILAIVRGLC